MFWAIAGFPRSVRLTLDQKCPPCGDCMKEECNSKICLQSCRKASESSTGTHSDWFLIEYPSSIGELSEISMWLYHQRKIGVSVKSWNKCSVLLWKKIGSCKCRELWWYTIHLFGWIQFTISQYVAVPSTEDRCKCEKLKQMQCSSMEEDRIL